MPRVGDVAAEEGVKALAKGLFVGDVNAAGLAAGPRASLAAAKRVIDAGVEEPLEAALRREGAAFVAVAATEDARIGVSSFLEHGPGRARVVGR